MKIRADFVTNSSSSNYIIETKLVKEVARPEVWYADNRVVLSSLKKYWTDTRSPKAEDIRRRYDASGATLDFMRARSLFPSSELNEGSEGAAALSAFEEALSEGDTLFVLESGYSSAAHMEEDVTPQMAILWPRLDEFVVYPGLADALRAAFNKAASWLSKGGDVELPAVERRRSPGRCTYFNATMSYVLSLLFGDHAVLTYVSGNADLLSELDIAPTLPNGLIVLAEGKKAEKSVFPDFPTDTWLLRLEPETKAVLGVYAVELSALEGLLALPIDEGFPKDDFLADYAAFIKDTGDQNIDRDFGYSLLAYLEHAAKRREAANINRFASISGASQTDDEDEYIGDIDVYALDREKLIGVDIAELDMTVRSYNCLKRANIHTVGDILAITEDALRKVRNLGNRSADEVIQKMQSLGLSLALSDDSEGKQ